MVKKILQDVLPPGTRSIRRIAIERDSVVKRVVRKMPEATSVVSRVNHSGLGVARNTQKNTRILDEDVLRVGDGKTNYPRVILWTLAGVSILFLLVALLLFFFYAKVEVIPSSESVSLNTTFVAKKDPLAGDLGYALMTITKKGEEVVPGIPGKKIEKRAIGNIILYNNFNVYPRKFIADTRLIAGNGKVYKLQSTVTIPGRKKINGKYIPGSVQARVYGEKPGIEYNMVLSDLVGDFRVVSFKSDPQYETFYGRQKTDIIGGMVTATFAVADSVAQSARARIRTDLKEQVIKEAFGQKPADFVLYHDPLLFIFESLPIVSKDTETVSIVERVTFNGVLFRKELLAHAIASSTSKLLVSTPVNSQGLDTLQFTLKNKKETITSSTNQFTFILNGTTTLIAKIFPEKIARDLVGKPGREFESIMATHKEVQEGSAVVKPFWLFAFPDSSEKIRVVEKASF